MNFSWRPFLFPALVALSCWATAGTNQAQSVDYSSVSVTATPPTNTISMGGKFTVPNGGLAISVKIQKGTYVITNNYRDFVPDPNSAEKTATLDGNAKTWVTTPYAGIGSGKVVFRATYVYKANPMGMNITAPLTDTEITIP